MPAGPVLHLDDPGVGIEADFLHQPFFNLSLRHGQLAAAAGERAIRRMSLLK